MMIPEEDARSLAEVWRRLERDLAPLADAMRAQAQAVTCCCVSGPDELEHGRCRRCQGLPQPFNTPTEDRRPASAAGRREVGDDRP